MTNSETKSLSYHKFQNKLTSLACSFDAWEFRIVVSKLGAGFGEQDIMHPYDEGISSKIIIG